VQRELGGKGRERGEREERGGKGWRRVGEILRGCRGLFGVVRNSEGIAGSSRGRIGK
jgi:hypothetical protein